MTPIRSLLPLRLTSCLADYRLVLLGLAVLGGGLLEGRAAAAPLPRSYLDDIRRILSQDRYVSPDVDLAVDTVTKHKRTLEEAAAKVPSLGDIARVLLLSEWRTATESLFDTSPVPLENLQDLVDQPDNERFRQELQKTVKGLRKNEDVDPTIQAVLMLINRQVHRRLLRRLHEGLQAYLQRGTATEKIAAANLVADTMSNARKLDVGVQARGTITEPGVPKVPPMPVPMPPGGGVPPPRKGSVETRDLRRVLRGVPGDPSQPGLITDIENLLLNRDPQVQAAGARALGQIEAEPGRCVAAINRLLSPDHDVVARRAAAGALGDMVEVAIRMNKEDNMPILRTIEAVFPSIARGMTDRDMRVRKASVEAAQKVADGLTDMVRKPGSVEGVGTTEMPLYLTAKDLPRFQPVVAVLLKNLPTLNQATRTAESSVEGREFRVNLCYVIEDLARVVQNLRQLKETTLPPLPLDEDNKEKKGLSFLVPPPRHRAAHRTGQWASMRAPAEARPVQPALLPAVGQVSHLKGSPPTPKPPRVEPRPAIGPAAMLGAPTRLQAQEVAEWAPADTGSGLRPVVYQAQPDLPRPREVDSDLQQTVNSMAEGLTDADVRIRLASIDVLETLGERAVSAIPAIVKALGDPSRFVRWGAARTLGRLAPNRADIAVPGLMCLFNDREDVGVRIAAAVALEKFGSHAKEAVPLLARVLNRGEREYRIAILHTIQGIGTGAADAIPSVGWLLLNDEIPTVRIEAARTLGLFGPLAKSQLPALKDAMLNDTDEDVRQAASSAILAIEGRPGK
jgi:HEAT repeat protein